MCGRCNDAVKYAPPGGEGAALAVAADNAACGKNRKHTAKKKPQKQGAAVGDSATPMADVPPAAYEPLKTYRPHGVLGVCLEFKDERDKKMYERVSEYANEHRRDPASEIMWILQDYIDTVNKLVGP
jgi:hypothetical protein